MKNNADNGFSLLEHTSDIGLKIQGSNLEELFRNGFYGLLSITASKREISGGKSKTIKLAAYDKESLLIDFLNELLYLINVKKWLPCKIIELNINGNNLVAVINGKKYTSPDAIKAEIKAATYHNIKIKNNVDIMETKVIFDL